MKHLRKFENYKGNNIERIRELKKLISNWDKLSKNNSNNKNNLSTSKRQDWVDELIELGGNE